MENDFNGKYIQLNAYLLILGCVATGEQVDASVLDAEKMTSIILNGLIKEYLLMQDKWP